MIRTAGNGVRIRKIAVHLADVKGHAFQAVLFGKPGVIAEYVKLQDAQDSRHSQKGGEGGVFSRKQSAYIHVINKFDQAAEQDHRQDTHQNDPFRAAGVHGADQNPDTKRSGHRDQYLDKRGGDGK